MQKNSYKLTRSLNLQYLPQDTMTNNLELLWSTFCFLSIAANALRVQNLDFHLLGHDDSNYADHIIRAPDNHDLCAHEKHIYRSLSTLASFDTENRPPASPLLSKVEGPTSLLLTERKSTPPVFISPNTWNAQDSPDTTNPSIDIDALALVSPDISNPVTPVSPETPDSPDTTSPTTPTFQNLTPNTPDSPGTTSPTTPVFQNQTPNIPDSPNTTSPTTPIPPNPYSGSTLDPPNTTGTPEQKKKNDKTNKIISITILATTSKGAFLLWIRRRRRLARKARNEGACTGSGPPSGTSSPLPI